jgi:multimeric flavodoxin WrbA
MSYLILNGMYEDDSFITKVEKIVSEEFQKKEINGETIILHEHEIKPCLGCFKCWVQTPGICIIDDYARVVAKKNIQSDNLVYITPITYGGYSAELKKAIDRGICLVSPFFRMHHEEIHHELRYDKYPNLFVIGILEKPDPEQEDIFTTLAYRNVLNNFAPKHSIKIIYYSENEEEIKMKISDGLSDLGDESV